MAGSDAGVAVAATGRLGPAPFGPALDEVIAAALLCPGKRESAPSLSCAWAARGMGLLWGAVVDVERERRN